MQRELVGSRRPDKLSGAAPNRQSWRAQAGVRRTLRREQRSVLGFDILECAACDGVVDNAERSRIIGALEGAGLDVHAAKFRDAEFARPATIAELAAAAKSWRLR